MPSLIYRRDTIVSLIVFTLIEGALWSFCSTMDRFIFKDSLPVRFVTCCTVLPMVSRHSTDLQGAVMHQEIKKCTNKGREEEDCKLKHVHVNNAGFKSL